MARNQCVNRSKKVKLKPETVVKLALFTRRFARDRNPLASWLCRKLVKLVYPKESAWAVTGPQTFLVEYEQGMIRVDATRSLDYSILFRGHHQVELVKLLRRVVRAGSVCLDIGANIGSLTLVLAYAAGPQGRIVAVEPHPGIARQLRHNLALNDIRNVCVVEAALCCEHDGDVPFYVFQDDASDQGVSSLTPSSRAAKRVTVRGMSGRTLLEETGISRCDFIKIDVEGHEMPVLRTLHGLICNCHPRVVFEYQRANWERSGYDVDEAIRMFQELGYETYYVTRGLIQPAGGNVPPETCDFFCVPPLGPQVTPEGGPVQEVCASEYSGH